MRCTSVEEGRSTEVRELAQSHTAILWSYAPLLGTPCVSRYTRVGTRLGVRVMEQSCVHL